ncbi:MAG TPA: PhzF family phenazine biosynthesis protein [Acidimicrobiales bacterium]|nr:PhzF family phenazine biosynthesis protein [Acidimicrobiales bacterium]
MTRRSRPFRQVDVFTDTPYRGNPVAVVLVGDDLDTEAMQRFARWTNLSETTFVLPTTDPGADYRVRIFTPGGELPFAGHPTLGTCHAWLTAGGRPRRPDVTVQQCGVGLVPVRRSDAGTLAFAAPPLQREGPVEEPLVQQVAEVLGIDRADVLDAEWVDNGPGWLAVLLGSVDAVLALRPGSSDLDIGVVALYPPADEGDSADPADPAIEVRAFFPKDGGSSLAEDPVTGSLNASLASWLLRTGRVTAPYVAGQGTVLGRAGRVSIDVDDAGTIWVGGGTVTCIEGTVTV